ncbi:hypothetical protein L484_022417 [Morus notabilis]|uniref:Uncharacterized protein n=1 Tax=Morus notabilis TaxID=981085 RepID=W9QTE6_9ROSA|nr:hypothetical protein L484_022417 [Morus notabilis]
MRKATLLLIEVLSLRREGIKTYKIGFVDVVDNGGAGEKRNNNDDTRPRQRRSARRLPPSAEFLIHLCTNEAAKTQ